MADPLSFALLFLFAGAAGAKKTPTPSSTRPRSQQAPTPPRPRARPEPPRAVELTPDVVVRTDDTTFPGPNWEKHIPVTADVAERAAELLPFLWSKGEGKGVVEQLGDKLIGFLSERHGDKKGVSAWRLKQGTIIRSRGGKPTGVIRHDIPKPPPKKRPAKPSKPAKKPSSIWEVPPKRTKKAKPAPRPAAPPVAPKKRRKKKRPVAEPAPAAQTPALPAPEEDQDESQYPFPLRPDKPVLMQGASGPAVAELQKLLGIGGTLGFFGPMTVEKLKAYQEENGLPVDGMAGEVTWGSLLA